MIKDILGNEIQKVEDFQSLLKHESYRLIAKTCIRNNTSKNMYIDISTVWLGIVDKDNRIFETVVFYATEKHDVFVTRYTTIQNAINGHDANVNEYIDFSSSLWYISKDTRYSLKEKIQLQKQLCPHISTYQNSIQETEEKNRLQLKTNRLKNILDI